MVLAAVDVKNRQRAPRRGVTVFRHRAGRLADNGGVVVRAGDRHVDLPGRRIVGRLHGQCVVHDLTIGERLNVGRRVVERVAPHAGAGIEGEAAVGSEQAGQSDRLEVVLAAVCVVNRQGAGR